MEKIVYLGADHRGYRLKEKVKEWLKEWGYQFEDEGAFGYNKDDDYPDFAVAVARKVAKDENGRGVLICGSGIGVAVAANKIKGARAGTAAKAEQAVAAVNDENLNILAVSADYLTGEEAEKVIRAFLKAEFSGEERHLRRVNKIERSES